MGAEHAPVMGVEYAPVMGVEYAPVKSHTLSLFLPHHTANSSRRRWWL
jgi:hypothetical protein